MYTKSHWRWLFGTGAPKTYRLCSQPLVASLPHRVKGQAERKAPLTRCGCCPCGSACPNSPACKATTQSARCVCSQPYIPACHLRFSPSRGRLCSPLIPPIKGGISELFERLRPRSLAFFGYCGGDCFVLPFSSPLPFPAGEREGAELVLGWYFLTGQFSTR